MENGERTTPTKPEIKNVSHTHHAMALWLLANPGATLREMSEFFGYTVPWLSTITHSDAFKRLMAGLQGEADALVLNDIPAKLRGVASQSLDALAEQVELAAQDNTTQHRDFLKSTSEMALRALGYGQPKNPTSPAAPGVQLNFVNVPPAVLERAQARLLANSSQVKESLVVELPETSQLSTGR